MGSGGIAPPFSTSALDGDEWPKENSGTSRMQVRIIIVCSNLSS
jgi:hypothetical protein